jgi:hypothetical protein
MLLDDEIDLLAGLARREDREALIGYPDAAMGNESYYLVKHDADTHITENPDSLNGSTIGVLDSAMVNVLNQYLEDNGIEVTSITGIGFNRVGEYAHASKEFLYRNAKKLKTEGAEVFFLSCMGLATMELVDILEEDLGMPVITSHQASLWSCLRHCRVNDKLPGLGKLFTL